MTTLHWGYKDIFRACRLGLSAKKIWMEFVGLLIGGAGYAILTYLAYLTSGVPVSAVWERFGLVPFVDPRLASSEFSLVHIHWWSWAIWGVALAYLLVGALVTGTAVAKVTYEQLRGDDFFEVKAAFRHAFGRLGAMLAAPLMPLLFAVFLVIMGLLLSLIGAIPVAGEVVVGLLALPAFGVSLFIVYLLLVFIASLVLVPAVAGTSRDDAFDTLFQVFSCVNEQPWRLVLYAAANLILSLLGALVLGWLSWLAIHLGAGVLGAFMGGKLQNVLSGGQFYLRLSPPSWMPFYPAWEQLLVGLSGGEILAEGVSQNIAALLVGVSTYCLLLFVIGYGGAVWNSGLTVILAVLTRKKDDKDILAEKGDDEFMPAELPGDSGTASSERQAAAPNASAGGVSPPA